ncbi:conserved exported hypothetical protein [Alteromonas sp. 38]|uniref:phage tail protein n=1 Tax=Alteromonas TaxID=226 RepID=UPI0012F07F19|nr:MULTISPECIES: tail fiber protein [Alteromonas]CAD5288381.1 conserved exported hypothetical protein [Alteromonas sp. 154]VXB26221.1 conserved exported hypothetical protein [Alteromonas sp. 38]
MKKLRCITPLATASLLIASIPLTAQANCGQEAYIASMCPFAGNFAPRSTAFAHGQLLAVSNNEALYSLIGTTYGGDGRTTFGLPDMRGRVAIHQGHGPGLSNYSIGSKGGLEQVTLSSNQLPSHTHAATTVATVSVNNTTLNADSTVTLMGSDSAANISSPAGNSLSQLGGRRARMYSSATPDVVMSNDAATLNVSVDEASLSAGVATTVGNSGNGLSHENRQPYLVVNWIITLHGIFPSRS